MALGHFLSYPKEIPFYVAEEAVTHESIIEEFPEYSYYVVGDNHATDLTNGVYLSPGSLTRRTAKQMQHKPCVWSLTKDGFEQHFLDVPPAEEVLSREHIDKKEAKEGRFDEWSEKVESSDVEDLDIESNLLNYFLKNKARKNTKEVILTTAEEVK